MTAIVLRGDAAHLPLPDASVDLIVTSPPYFGQRDYRDGGQSLAGQIGSEETPAEYIAALLRCTREWVRVLKPSGSIFVNLGDKYSQRTQTRRSSHQPGIHVGRFEEFSESRAERAAKGATRMPHQNVINGGGGYVAEKSLMGLPWRYALACMDDLGLINRRDNIWHKTSGLPESVDDRCATRHEYVFHFTREPRYFSGIDEIREPHVMKPQRRPTGHKERQRLGMLPAQTYNTSRRDEVGVDGHPLGKLPGSVWEIPISPLVVPEHIAHADCCEGRKREGCQDGLEHYAAFPPDLVKKAILGWSPSGICLECGEGRRPVVERPSPLGRVSASSVERVSAPRGRMGATSTVMLSGSARMKWEEANPPVLTGYACACPQPDAPVRPALVVDPFGGTGTSALVADVFGRTGVTIDRSADYCRLARWRTRDPGERARALGVPKPPPVSEGQASLFDEAI